MSGPLNATFSAAGVPEIMDFDFVPWGNAYYNTKKCHTWGFDKEKGMTCWVKECGGDNPPDDCFTTSPMHGILCQHGKEECEADTLEACVMHLHPEPAAYVPFLYCFEGVGQSQQSVAQKCATENQLDWSAISSCPSNSTLTASLDAANAARTAKLGTAKIGTPWILVNGEQTDPDKLLHAVCAAASPAPAGCAGLY